MQLKKQLEEEMNLLGNSLQQFRMASNKYEDQKQILTQMAEPDNKNQSMLIPLTQSLFIEGFVFIQALLKIKRKSWSTMGRVTISNAPSTKPKILATEKSNY